MTRIRLWLPLLAALFLSACGTLPTPATGTDSSTESPYALRAPRGKSPSLIPSGPLSVLSIANAETALPKSTVAPLAAPQDLWERMRRGFAMPDLDNDLVHDREQWYVSRPDYIQRMTERSSKYLFHIVEELERRNLPQELALLPFVESAFNPNAVSTAKAAGMWQFMPATGRHFDLKQNAFRDDRRDVLASTKAALDYLQRLYKMFGDWHLALAAYNWGEGSVMRAIKRNQQAGLPTGYNDLRMPTETRYYVPKLQAIKNVVANPALLGATLPDIGNHPFFDTVTLKHDIDVSVIAQLADVQEKDFRQLNPSHTKPVILAAGTPTILLPWDNAHLFEERIGSYTGVRATWTAWSVPRNMSPKEAAQLNDISENELRDINKIPPRMVLRAGSTLLVPRSAKSRTDVSGHVADNAQVLLAPEPVPVKFKSIKIKARAGDTLRSVARRYKVTPEQLSDWNSLAVSTKLKPGQALVIKRPMGKSQGTGQSGSSKATGKTQRTSKSRVKKAATQPGSKKKKP